MPAVLPWINLVSGRATELQLLTGISELLPNTRLTPAIMKGGRGGRSGGRGHNSQQQYVGHTAQGGFTTAQQGYGMHGGKAAYQHNGMQAGYGAPPPQSFSGPVSGGKGSSRGHASVNPMMMQQVCTPCQIFLYACVTNTDPYVTQSRNYVTLLDLVNFLRPHSDRILTCRLKAATTR